MFLFLVANQSPLAMLDNLFQKDVRIVGLKLNYSGFF